MAEIVAIDVLPDRENPEPTNATILHFAFGSPQVQPSPLGGVHYCFVMKECAAKLKKSCDHNHNFNLFTKMIQSNNKWSISA